MLEPNERKKIYERFNQPLFKLNKKSRLGKALSGWLGGVLCVITVGLTSSIVVYLMTIGGLPTRRGPSTPLLEPEQLAEFGPVLIVAGLLGGVAGVFLWLYVKSTE